MEALEEAFIYLLDGTVRFPGISMANLFSALVEKDYYSAGAQAVRQIFEWMVERLGAAYPKKEPAAVRVTCTRWCRRSCSRCWRRASSWGRCRSISGRRRSGGRWRGICARRWRRSLEAA